ncbi:phage major capsid protein [Micromonospora sp. NPDC050495]|uniref:phage major capsid protein n=1 Tax=Micromonospora sp. NPDC050495 TaxID=3154936 RepID=UPI0033C3AA55
MARSISIIRAELDEARAKRSRIEADMGELDRAIGDGTPTAGQQERWERLTAGQTKARVDVERLDEEMRDAVTDLAAGGSVIGGDGARQDGGDQARRGPQRDKALRFVEAAERAGELPTHSADKVDRLLRTGTTGERSNAARWAEAAGDPDYLRAFGKLLADPQRGHLTWDGRESEAYRRARALGDEMRSAMSTGNNVGGELIPLSLDPSILLTSDGSINPIRRNSRVVQTATNQHRVVTSAGATAEWKTEAAEAADGSPALAEVDIPLFLADANVVYSYELAWSTRDLVAELQPVVMDAVDQLEATAFTTGNGTTAPQGLITGLVGTSSEINSSVSEAFTAADIYALQNALPPRFSDGAAWYANIAIVNAARQFETTNGAIKFPELMANPPSLLGRRVWETSNMDGSYNAAATASNYVMVYGNLSRAYVVVDRIGSFVEITPRLGANSRPKGERNMTLYRMTGAKVVRPQAARLLDVPTTA